MNIYKTDKKSRVLRRWAVKNGEERTRGKAWFCKGITKNGEVIQMHTQAGMAFNAWRALKVFQAQHPGIQYAIIEKLA